MLGSAAKSVNGLPAANFLIDAKRDVERGPF